MQNSTQVRTSSTSSSAAGNQARDAADQHAYISCEAADAAREPLCAADASLGAADAPAGMTENVSATVRLARLETALAQLESLRANEHQVLAQTLHDDLGSVLTALGMRLAVLFRRLPPSAGLADDVAEIKSLLSDVTKTVHRLHMGVRPATLDHFGIEAAIEGLLAEHGRVNGPICRFTRLPGAPDSDDPALGALFAQLQDSLGMFARIGGTAHVDVTFGGAGPALLLALDGNYSIAASQAHRAAVTAIEERASRVGVHVVLEEYSLSGVRLRFTPIAAG